MAQVTKIKRTAKEIQTDIDQNKKRLLQLQTLGDKACSDYDLSMGYNANYYLNVWKVNAWRIELYTKELEQLKNQSVQLYLFQ